MCSDEEEEEKLELPVRTGKYMLVILGVLYITNSLSKLNCNNPNLQSAGGAEHYCEVCVQARLFSTVGWSEQSGYGPEIRASNLA